MPTTQISDALTSLDNHNNSVNNANGAHSATI
jgi:hypothetical protein